MKVVLPSFLLTHEDYLQIEVPPVKNFVISEKDRSLVRYQVSYDENYNGESEVINVTRKRRSFVIITIVVFLVAVLGLGIYFALNL